MADLRGDWRVRPLTAGDHARWRVLYAAYAASYRVEQSDEQAERTWDWLLDPAHEVEGLVVVDEAGEVAGLERGWSVVRWITADDNYRARAKYDRVAVRTTWITYDMPPGRPVT